MFKGHVVTGTVTGTGSAINVELGFSPKAVVLINETDPGLYVWLDTMADAEMLKLVDGTVALTFPTSNGVSGYAGVAATTGTGFTIGADSDANAASDVIHYLAIGGDD